MTGFIRGLFGAKANDKAERAVPEKKVAPKKESKAYFLEVTDARTMGNTEYMSTAKTVRRTFPKTAGQPEELELIQQISAMNRIVGGEAASSVGPAFSAVEVPSPEIAQEVKKLVENEVVTPVTERRKADSSMDMFRNMVREMKKK